MCTTKQNILIEQDRGLTSITVLKVYVLNVVNSILILMTTWPQSIMGAVPLGSREWLKKSPALQSLGSTLFSNLHTEMKISWLKINESPSVLSQLVLALTPQNIGTFQINTLVPFITSIDNLLRSKPIPSGWRHEQQMLQNRKLKAKECNFECN